MTIEKEKLEYFERVIFGETEELRKKKKAQIEKAYNRSRITGFVGEHKINKAKAILKIKKHQRWAMSRGIEGEELNQSGWNLKGLNLNLNNLYLDRIDLSNANLSGCDFSGTKFYNSNLNHVNFDNAILAGCDFSNSSMHGTTFRNAILNNSTFYSFIVGADFSFSNVFNADFDGAFIKNSIFTNLKHANTASWRADSIIGMIADVDVLVSLPEEVINLFGQNILILNMNNTRVSEDATWDFFISYASEDKESIAEPLANSLTKIGFKVWIDSMELTVGDSLWGKINDGISLSKYGIIILSESYISKNWTNRELRGLLTKEEFGDKTILPIWHNIDEVTIKKYSPILADKLALTTDKNIDVIAREIIKGISPNLNYRSNDNFSENPNNAN